MSDVLDWRIIVYASTILFYSQKNYFPLFKVRYIYDVNENCPIFKSPPLHPCPATSNILPTPWSWTSNSTPLILDVQFQTNLPSPFENQSIKRKLNPTLTFLSYQVFTSGRLSFPYQLINLVWLSSDFFSFNWRQSRPQSDL